MAWLVYRGELVSSSQTDARALSFWLASYLATRTRRQQLLDEELHLEQLRAAKYPHAVSRLRGFYVFPDTISLERAMTRWGASFRPEFVAEVAVSPDSIASKHDAEWVTSNLGAGRTDDWMHAYLSGEPAGKDAIWELIVSGRALVLGKSLREQAYLVLKETWPDSLALLEFARVGVELDSDLGLITAMVCGEEVRYAMNFADATNPRFLEAFAAFDGEKNTTDLTPESDLILPDLRERSFHL